jgi:DNA repair protein RecO (recombination protein O)
LPLPSFLIGGDAPNPAALADGLALTGHFLARDVLATGAVAARIWAARERLLALLMR